MLVNDAYLRDAILNPSQHVTAGYAPIMPTYQGQISEDGSDRPGGIHQESTTQQLPYVQQTLVTSQSNQAAPTTPGMVKPMSTAAVSTLHDYRFSSGPEHGHGFRSGTIINNEHGMLSWLLTGDHKRIAMLYLISITFFFFIGGAFAGLDPAGAADAAA